MPELVLDPSLGVDVAARLELLLERRLLLGRYGGEAAIGLLGGKSRELVLLDEPEANTGVLLDFLLQVLREGLVALGRDDGEGVEVLPADPLARLIDADAKAPADGLATLPLGTQLAKRADLKHIGVVQPSRSAEWENMNFCGVSRSSSSSFFRMISRYARPTASRPDCSGWLWPVWPRRFRRGLAVRTCLLVGTSTHGKRAANGSGWGGISGTSLDCRTRSGTVSVARGGCP